MNTSSPDIPDVEVVAAVLMSGDEQHFVLACRPEGKAYAGYWEFPGGKIEAGETPREALARELREELGIRVTEASPWLVRDFDYPHARVHIRFWRVTAWEGEIGVSAPLEHSAVCWLNTDGPCKLAPMLPANLPILKALALPTRMGITQASKNGVRAELERLEKALEQGLRCVQIREHDLPDAKRQGFVRSVMALATPKNAFVVLNEDGSGRASELARLIGAHGIHLTSKALTQSVKRPNYPWVGASCHDAAELAQASALELDYALLGPVLPTPSHPEHPGLGWEAFAGLLENARLPVFAIGGQDASTLKTAQSFGAHGVAGVRGQMAGDR
ncbi:MAG: Nudix family hydrolase [Zoogloeaceae bacterium]|jgi:8-oxo-dGTP diphosphatase|nr:Nudix family hydrolase [Zoogloeaceae bacterium]